MAGNLQIEGCEPIDVGFGGRPGLICAWLVDGVLIDCGPASCLPRLLEGLAGRRPQTLLLTHVHLDHAGAAGDLAALWPDLQVRVHPRGAAHLIDPSRLLDSAARVFGDQLQSLFGGLRALPAERVVPLEDGERVAGLECLFTPGHASHHAAFLRDDGTLFAGDVAGVRLAAGEVVPPTPPPDIDLDLWERSLARIEARAPERLALPHFGAWGDAPAHLAALREALERNARWAAEDEERFVRAQDELLRARMDAEQASDYELVASARQGAAGLHRWLQRARAAAD